MLDDAQKAVVTSTASNILVIAGSGSGKTRVLTERIRHLLENGVDAADIVAITFTNMAADEMRDRLGNIDHLFVGTIHAYANQILMKSGVSMDEWQNAPKPFDTLLRMATSALGVAKHNYVLVDEFQDVANLEYNFIMSLRARHYFFVGDDWQFIYGFKGGNVQYFFDLMDDPAYKKYYLSNNYRSGNNILKIAGKEIRKVRKKVQKEVKPLAPYPGIVEELTLKQAIDEVIKTENYRDWFFLVRTNKELDAVAQLFMSKWLPYVTFKKGDTTLDGMNIMLDSDCIKLLTIHSAKGLESKNVVLTGTRYWNDDELRVNYVGMTRAKERLILCQ